MSAFQITFRVLQATHCLQNSYKKWDRAGGIATCYGLHDPVYEPCEGENFRTPLGELRGQPSLIIWLRGVKRPKREADLFLWHQSVYDMDRATSAACWHVVCVVLFGTDVGRCSVRNEEKQRNGNGREYMKV